MPNTFMYWEVQSADTSPCGEYGVNSADTSLRIKVTRDRRCSYYSKQRKRNFVVLKTNGETGSAK